MGLSRGATLGLSRACLACLAALGLSRVALGFAALGLWVGQLASAPSAHPLEVSSLGAPPGFQVWAPSPLIWVRASQASGERWGCFSPFTVQGLRGKGCQRLLLLLLLLLLLRRVL